MFGSEIFDVAIGLFVVYFLVSTICSTIREGIEAWLKTRAAYLEHGIRKLLQDGAGVGLARSLFEHPMIAGLSTATQYQPGPNTPRPGTLATGRDRPSYIPSKNFAIALMDIAARGPIDAGSSDKSAAVISLVNIRNNIATIQSPPIQRVLLSAVDAAQENLDQAQANIEAWYDSAMDRISGWYKRSTQIVIFVIALFVAVGLNINSIAIIDHLSTNKGSREAAVAYAQKASGTENYKEARTQLEKLKLPIGWSGFSVHCPNKVESWWAEVFAPLVGWLLTAIAATLGAPFWFDVLNKFMVIRSTVKPTEKSPQETSEDRQAGKNKPSS